LLAPVGYPAILDSRDCGYYFGFRFVVKTLLNRELIICTSWGYKRGNNKISMRISLSISGSVSVSVSGAVRFCELTPTGRSGNDGLFEQRVMGCVSHGAFTERPCAMVNKGADEE